MKKLIFFILFGVVSGLVSTADAQTSTNTNSIVRFRISYGATRWGNVDVELFDTIKPITVSNFLSYVQSGAYQNTLLYRLDPTFVLQGGGYIIANPYSSSLFDTVFKTPANPPITNEFLTGSVISNTFGTLAMAKLGGDPDSATVAWYFNLGANSVLDTNNGGYTVFGRVISGSNILHAFTTQFTRNNGIIDTFQYELFLGCGHITEFPANKDSRFDELPVGYYGAFCPRYQDLFVTQISMLSGQDVLPPKVTIASPAANATITSENVAVTGTASDALGVALVEVFLNDTNAPLTATGSSNWSITLTNVPVGTNTITVIATDTTGNKSQPAIRSFFRSVRAPLGLQIVPDGGGTVSGATDGQLLELTRFYTLTAKAASGYLFAGWTGSVNRGSATLRFQMESNFAVTALFVPNPFPPVKGVYNGLFSETNGVKLGRSGFLTVAVTDRGTYAAKLFLAGKTHPFSGTLSVDGKGTNLITRPGTNSVIVRLAIDLTDSSDTLTGEVTDFNWTARLEGDRAVFNSAANPAPLAGRYTLIVAGMDVDRTTIPLGDGFGTVTVAGNGRISLAGTLADGTKVVQKVPMSKNGDWPLFASLYAGQGELWGWVKFDTNQPSSDLSGTVTWIKPAQPTAKLYPLGFTNDFQLIGSRYVPPIAPAPVLNFTDAMVSLVGAGLPGELVNVVTLNADSKVINQSANQLVLTIAKPTGAFTGAMTIPQSTQAVPFKGVVLQKPALNYGSGFFTFGTNQQSGRVYFGE